MNLIDIGQIKVRLLELGDADWQRRAWTDPSSPDISSFPELISMTFDDTGLSDAIEKGLLKSQVGEPSANAIMELSQAIDRVDQSLPSVELLSHPQMDHVRSCARQAFATLKKQH